MGALEDVLQRFEIILLDGAMATELEAHGCDINDSLWSAKILLENPQMIEQVHYEYFCAGADCAITASYQATIPGFRNRGLSEEDARSLIAKSVMVAQQAREHFWQNALQDERPYPFIAGSVGPYGAYLADGSEYRGNYGLTAKELEFFHQPRIQILTEAGADILACETIPCLLEAQVLAETVCKASSLECWITFSCKDGKHICDGTPIEDCAKALGPYSNIKAIGVNCTPPEYVEELIKRLKNSSDKLIVVYPNSGEIYDGFSKTWHGAPDGMSFSQRTKIWQKAGASMIGGCCRTGPKDITEMVQLLRD